jgi:hypothetical protein
MIANRARFPAGLGQRRWLEAAHAVAAKAHPICLQLGDRENPCKSASKFSVF